MAQNQVRATHESHLKPIVKACIDTVKIVEVANYPVQVGFIL